MDIAERKNKILELIRNEGSVKVQELSALFGISDVTIRMDLADLEAKGLLSRVHGGAVNSYKTYYNMNLQQRLGTNQEKKQCIAAKAVELIEENDTIMINSGTTTLMVFRMIPQNMNLSIVTNSVAIALEASENPNFNTVLLGGSVNPKYQFIYGDTANYQLSKYYADKLILSVDGIDCENGLSTYYGQEAEICRIMMEKSSSKIIVADDTKIGRTAFANIAGLSDVNYIITNNNPATKEHLANIGKTVRNIVVA